MSVRFQIHGTKATVSGVEQHDIRSIFDAAAINYYDDLRKLRAKKRLTANEKETRDWLEHQLKVLETLKQAVDAGIRATFPKRPERPLTKKERWALVNNSKKERELLDNLLVAVRAG